MLDCDLSVRLLDSITNAAYRSDGHLLKGTPAYYDDCGAFADCVVNVILQHSLQAHHLPGWNRIFLANAPVPHPDPNNPVQPFRRGSTREQFLSLLPPGHECFNLAWNSGTGETEGPYGHAVCIKRNPADGHWYLIDSEKGV